jgi:hypothetical protein
MPPVSTSLSIVRQSLDDIIARLKEMPSSQRVAELRVRASAYDRAVRGWDRVEPTAEERAHMLTAVLNLNVDVIAAGQTSQLLE